MNQKDDLLWQLELAERNYTHAVNQRKWHVAQRYAEHMLNYCRRLYLLHLEEADRLKQTLLNEL